tara:strand:+ start:252 stop:512 length:261 start_codon:yes stop_codon:yes gene_type:complete
MRTYITSAAPYCSVNSTCYVVQVKYNAAPQVLIPVFKEASDPIPTKENDLINALENNSHNFDMSCTIDTLKRNIIDHDDNLESESI